jgi:hypothetical protein
VDDPHGVDGEVLQLFLGVGQPLVKGQVASLHCGAVLAEASRRSLLEGLDNGLGVLVHWASISRLNCLNSDKAWVSDMGILWKTPATSTLR